MESERLNVRDRASKRKILHGIGNDSDRERGGGSEEEQEKSV